jgi:AAA+ superfamily predicted ATPase
MDDTTMDDATLAKPTEPAHTISPKHSSTQKRSQIIVSSDQTVQVPWVEKYRPAKLEDLVAHEDIVSILTRLIDSDNLPHLLLYGPPGTGKVREEIRQ